LPRVAFGRVEHTSPLLGVGEAVMHSVAAIPVMWVLYGACVGAEGAESVCAQ